MPWLAVISCRSRSARIALDRADDGRHEWVRDVGDQQSDGGARATSREGLSEAIGAEAELPRGGMHALRSRLGNAVLVVHGTGRSLEAHAGECGHVGQRRATG